MDTPKLTQAMQKALAIAEREGQVSAGNGAHAGHVEHVNASAILGLVRRGLLMRVFDSEGGLAGRLPPRTGAQLNHEIQDALARTVTQATIEAWERTMTSAASDLDFTDPEDRSVFRGRVSERMRGLKTATARALARYWSAVPRDNSHDAAVRACADAWLRRSEKR